MKRHELRKVYKQVDKPFAHLILLPAPKPLAAPLEDVLSKQQFGQYLAQKDAALEVADFNVRDEGKAQARAPYGGVAHPPRSPSPEIF